MRVGHYTDQVCCHFLRLEKVIIYLRKAICRKVLLPITTMKSNGLNCFVKVVEDGPLLIWRGNFKNPQISTLNKTNPKIVFDKPMINMKHPSYCPV